jgi:ZIP family zinc transporter
LLLALAVATLAVLLGLLLGLAPTASRRALGPLRTLALTAVIAVVALHLLPEALAELGVLGLAVFAAGLALPRWLGWITGRRAGHGSDENAPHGLGERLGLELGFWGLLVHHLGDGLALGAYSRVDARGHSHGDVLFALVLHTVPLVAVVAAGYARRDGRRVAISRSAQLALASVVGVFAARLVPEALVSGAQAWIAAGVSGLLLHGLTHDLGRDLPTDRAGRAFDLAMAAVGAALGVLGAVLDAHGELASAPVGQLLNVSVQRCALPLAIGLLLGALLASRREASFSRYARVAEVGKGGVFSPEAFLTTLAHFGFLFAVTRDLLGVLLLPLRLEAAETEPLEAAQRAAEKATTPESSSSFGRFVHALDVRVDRVAAWALVGALVAAVIRAAVPDGALAGSIWISVLFALLFSVSVPLHAVAAVELAFALSGKGLDGAAALLIVVIAPLGLKPLFVRPALLSVTAALVCGAVGAHVPRQLLTIEPRLAQAATVFVFVLVLRRAYLRGFRGFLQPIVVAQHAETLESRDAQSVALR